MAFRKATAGGVAVHFIPVLRPDRTLLYLPSHIAKRLKLKTNQKMTKDQLDDAEVTALLTSRLAANKGGNRCSVEWHIKNGYAS